MYFKKSGPIWTGFTNSQKKYAGYFPDQKIPMKWILDDTDDNPLVEPCPPDQIRYFHFPSNNMSWIEVSCDYVATFPTPTCLKPKPAAELCYHWSTNMAARRQP